MMATKRKRAAARPPARPAAPRRLSEIETYALRRAAAERDAAEQRLARLFRAAGLEGDRVYGIEEDGTVVDLGPRSAPPAANGTAP